MKNTLFLLVVSALLTGSAAAQTEPAARATDARTRSIYVSVVDGKGVAVTGLRAADFNVREDGVAREVLSATQATEPLHVVLLVDDSQAATDAIPYIRDGVRQFIDRLQGKASIGVVTIGERPTSMSEPTSDAEAAKKGAARIFARPGSGAYLLEGIREVTRGLRMREAPRPVIVALTMEGIEFSTLAYDQVLSALYESGAALHVLAVGTPTSQITEEVRNKNIVIAEGTEGTGGRRDQLLSELAIPAAMTRLADELLKQYIVTYGRPEALVQPQKVQVTVKKPDLKARARTRLPNK